MTTKTGRYETIDIHDYEKKNRKERFDKLKKIVTTVRELKTDSPKTGIFSKKQAKTFKTSIYMFVRIFYGTYKM